MLKVTAAAVLLILLILWFLFGVWRKSKRSFRKREDIELKDISGLWTKYNEKKYVFDETLELPPDVTQEQDAESGLFEPAQNNNVPATEPSEKVQEVVADLDTLFGYEDGKNKEKGNEEVPKDSGDILAIIAKYINIENDKAVFEIFSYKGKIYICKSGFRKAVKEFIKSEDKDVIEEQMDLIKADLAGKGIAEDFKNFIFKKEEKVHKSMYMVISAKVFSDKFGLSVSDVSGKVLLEE